MKDEPAAESRELRRAFLELRDIAGLAALLKVTVGRVVYYAYKGGRERYTVFSIPKKNGGDRRIEAPPDGLKRIQRRLNRVLQATYRPMAPAHGFVAQRSILTNARLHLRKGSRKWILNIDIKDFFPSITSRRVAGLLQAKPYELPSKVAWTVAHLCCFRGALPQGAPSSPVIANMICGRLDRELMQLAKESGCMYTRYADDITFSSGRRDFPAEIARIEAPSGEVVLGERLEAILAGNWFDANPAKIRLRSRTERQEITGLVVNKFPNVRRRFIRQISAMLHAWDKFGVKHAGQEHDAKYSKGTGQHVNFRKVVRGKIAFVQMVRGEGDPVYQRLLRELSRIDREYRVQIGGRELAEPASLKVYTEGASDWKHLKAALITFQRNARFRNLQLEFHESESPRGAQQLLQDLKTNVDSSDANQHCVYIFDRDVSEILTQVQPIEQSYKKWSKNFYSMALPVPRHRIDTPAICVEMYYQDADLRAATTKGGKRLFLSTDFEPKSGRHKDPNAKLVWSPRKKTVRDLEVIDSNVFDQNERDVCLSKSEFARRVLEGDERFGRLNIGAFALVFEILQKIVEQNPLTEGGEH